MYRWQTITMARVEANRHDFGTTGQQVAAIKRFLLDIGLQHFPDPEVSYPPAMKDTGLIQLRWQVDDRELSVHFCINGRVEIIESGRTSPGYIGSSGLIVPNGDDVQRAVRFLLFDTYRAELEAASPAKAESTNCGTGMGGFSAKEAEVFPSAFGPGLSRSGL